MGDEHHWPATELLLQLPHQPHLHRGSTEEDVRLWNTDNKLIYQNKEIGP